ncbi:MULTISPECIES: hypothetical protein [unclassified Methylophaga]|jgi:uncharacterized membrane protein YjjB (DUF3815 family)|uniref:hypothetical protein n=1 Tax=unclassified Methylophaga TaxID=2629249 RepID=UPI00259C7C66|nr:MULTISPECIES: hypothetical protein [unclassified Methylophaga]|tara:strand:+ start:40818 stop:41045 length:228 start_codon:yes stop_codon:yes gene_type:complete
MTKQGFIKSITNLDDMLLFAFLCGLFLSISVSALSMDRPFVMIVGITGFLIYLILLLTARKQIRIAAMQAIEEER